MRHFLLCITFLAIFLQQNACSHEQYQFLVLSDLHFGNPYPMTINPSEFNSKNDLDIKTFLLLQQDLDLLLKQNKVQPNITLLLGDLVDHEIGRKGSPEQIETSLFTCFDNLQKTLTQSHHIPIAYVFGNNDSLGSNYHEFFYEKAPTLHSPFEVAQKAGYKSGFMTSDAVCNSKPVAFPCLQTSHPKEGFYTAYLAPGLKLIAMNTVLFDASHTSTFPAQEQHVDLQLQWFRTQLQQASEAQDSVVIAMHIPPGKDFFKNAPMWEKKAEKHILDSIAQYPQLHIASIFASHTHNNSLRILESTNTKRIIPLILSPGLSTAHGNAPAFNEFFFEKNDRKWELVNYKNYGFIQDHFQEVMDFQAAYCGKDKKDKVSGCLATYDHSSEDAKRLWETVNRYYFASNPNISKSMPGRENAEELRIQF